MIRWLARTGLLLSAIALPGCRTTGTASGEARTCEVWRVVEHPDGKPPVWFSFPPPFEEYAGEFPRVEGELRFDQHGASGWFRVPILEVTLGEADLDANVRHNTEMLAGGTHPTSTFNVRSIAAFPSDLQSETAITLLGELELKGATVEVQPSATLQEASSNGVTVRHLRGRFAIVRLRERFQISGPGTDDDPQGDRVEVRFDVTLAQVKD